MVKWTEADRNVLLGNPNPSTGKMQQTLAKLADFAAQNLPGTGEAITGLVQRSTVYNVGQQVKSPNCPVNFVLECTDAGQTASSQIAWPEPVEGVVVLDGTVSWTFKKLGASVWDATVPAWWLERGDGSLGDKVCTNGEIFEGVYNFNSFTVPAGVTVYVNSTAKILCQGSFTNNGVVSGGGRAISRIGYFGGCGAVGLKGNRGGGYDAAGTYHNYQSGYIGSPNTNIIDRVMIAGVHSFACGSQGGTGGDNTQDRPGGAGGMGGAGIIIVAKSIYNAGSINSDGAQGGWNSGYSPGSGQGGGGGGGVVIAIADTVKDTGTISVNGGNNGAGAGWYKIINLGVM